MGIFHEFFPIAKTSVGDCGESQRNAEFSCEFGGGDVGPADDSTDESSTVPRKPGLTQKVREIVEGTQQQIDQSKIIELQLLKIHRMIEKFDDIHFFVEPSHETYDVNPQRFRVAACESILSADRRPCQEKKKPVAKPASETKPASKPFSRADLKSSQKLPLPSKRLTKTVSMPLLSTSKPISESTSTLAIPKKYSRCSQKLPSPDVQQILKAAKEKRKSNRSEIKIPVVELKLFK